MQDRTRSEKERFRTYANAQDVIDNYKSDLSSATAKRVNAELEHLKSPALPSVKEDFLNVAGDS